MYQITVATSFTARHQLDLPHGMREPDHEHLWRVEATVRSETLDDCDLVMDFHVLERYLREVTAPLSAVSTIKQLPEFSYQNPSAERVAEFIFKNLRPRLPQRVALAQVVVWEEGSCRAVFEA